MLYHYKKYKNIKKKLKCFFNFYFNSIQYNSIKMINNQLSLYIPRVFKVTTKDKIKETFDNLSIGVLDHIDLIEGNKYNSAYIHFEYWFDNNSSKKFQEEVMNKNSKVYYDKFWYWMVFQNKSAKNVKNVLKIVNNNENFVQNIIDYNFNDMSEFNYLMEKYKYEDEYGMTDEDYIRCENYFLEIEDKQIYREYFLEKNKTTENYDIERGEFIC